MTVVELTLFDVPGAARATDPETSKDAAFAPGLNAQRLAVLLALVPADATAYDLTLRLTQAVQQNVVARRLDDLQANGYARPTDDKRPGSSTRLLRVWTATNEGRKVVGL